MEKIYSIGHSTKTWKYFTEQLEWIQFDYLVDVRSRPYSRFVPHFNRNQIIDKLWDKYIFMWDSLGWMDEEISYEKFMYWVDKLVALTKGNTVAFFCSEKSEFKCHRLHKITPELEIRWFKVIHL